IFGLIGIIVAIICGALGGLSGGLIFGKTIYSRIAAGLFFGILLIVFFIWIFLIISSNFYKKSYKLVGDYFKVDLFELSGKFLFWGACLTIVIVGLALTFISYIMLAIAFFSLPDNIRKE
ncbi:MAG: DUF996 domain-containing protein, partial [Candidatus Omnitrophica bacterium]|nr:DUF996 domain-containing protein [Candidatus Omnitrophota bacterium]